MIIKTNIDKLKKDNVIIQEIHKSMILTFLNQYNLNKYDLLEVIKQMEEILANR